MRLLFSSDTVQIPRSLWDTLRPLRTWLCGRQDAREAHSALGLRTALSSKGIRERGEGPAGLPPSATGSAALPKADGEGVWDLVRWREQKTQGRRTGFSVTRKAADRNNGC